MKKNKRDIPLTILQTIMPYFSKQDDKLEISEGEGLLTIKEKVTDSDYFFKVLDYQLFNGVFQLSVEIKPENANSVKVLTKKIPYNALDRYFKAWYSLLKQYDSIDIFKTSFAYEFADDDLERVQELINLLRKDISSSELFEADHKRRLLNRLEKLQSELHKKVSDLDRFWGLMGEAGVAIGKFGNDVKPMVDRIREIADIIWRTQSKSEGLPSGSKIPFLGKDDSDK